MAKFKIIGGKKLKGEIKTVGSKNAALPLLCAALLTKEECLIENVPAILDVEVMLKILKGMGARVEKEDSRVKIKADKLSFQMPNSELVRRLRASVLLLAPLLYRWGKISLAHPGGCVIGTRPVGTHFDALESLGAKISQDAEAYHLSVKVLRGSNFYMNEPSVTATENALMAAVVAEGETTINYAAAEPHIVNLAAMLSQMGGKISGAGTNTIRVQGVKKLKGAKVRVIPDEIEAGTFAALAGATGSSLTIADVHPNNLMPIRHKLKQMGVVTEIKKGNEQYSLLVKKDSRLKPARIQVAPWPGFPTDLQAPFVVLATQAPGTSLVHEWMYDRRLFYIDELIKMGAKIVMCDPHRALITGPTKLFGAQIVSPDIRAGIGLLIATLVAKGESVIDNVELIDRGYEDIENRLGGLGAEIKRTT